MNHKEVLKDLREGILEDSDGTYVRDLIEDKILKDGDELLYLVRFGSHLYGLETEDSDLDLKGIVLPSEKSLILNNSVGQYGPYSSGGDESSNSSEDIDLELWSVHKFFKLLQKGDTNAYDVLYSGNSEVIEYVSDYFLEVFYNKDKLSGSKAIRGAFVGYSYGQVKRYEAKGFNFSTLKAILRFIKEVKDREDYNDNDRLSSYIDEMIEYVNEENKELQIEVVEDNKDTYVKINDYKKYPVGIRLKQFRDSIQKWANEYGSRVRNNDDGVDWKSISHAFRVLMFADELVTRGDFSYPFRDEFREELLAIKNGEVDFKKKISELSQFVDKVGDKLEHLDKLRSKPNVNKMRELILMMYGRD
jgi:hypothetical protein